LVCGKYGEKRRRMKMLDAVKEIGDIILGKKISYPLETLLEDPNAEGKCKNVFCLTFEERERKYQYKGIEREEYSTDKLVRYLYRSGSNNGANFSPSTKVTKIDKTLKNKIIRWFKEVLSNKNIKLSTEERAFLENLSQEIMNNKEKLIKEYNELIKEIPKKEGGIFLTFKFRSPHKIEYLGDKEVFVRILQDLLRIKEGKKGSTIGICSICLEEKEVSVGNGIYTFFTVDKPGFIAGGFKKKEAWKNFPLCEDCRRSLEKGKEYINKELTFKLGGLSYQLIPKFVIGKEFVKEDVLNTFFETNKLINLRKREAKKYLTDEEDILNYLSFVEDNLTLNFLFIERRQSAEKILALIEDVLPSRFRTIFNIKDKIDKLFETDFTFRNLWTFFSKSDPNNRDQDLINYFLDIVDRIFKARPIDKNFLMQFIMKRVRIAFVREEYFPQVVKDAIMSLLFLTYLNLIQMEVKLMDEERLFDPVFKRFSPTFDHPVKKGLFLLGALTQMLLNIQYSQRESTPFRKQLKSLKMEEKDFKGLLPKVINKLQEYDAFDKGKQKIAEEASYYLLQAGDNWKLSNDELNFYFVCGMNLLPEITSIVYEKTN
jgi:CRISPR-associated protein Csh1